MLRFARAMMAAAAEVKDPLGNPIEMRTGLHSGSVCSELAGWQNLPKFTIFGE